MTTQQLDLFVAAPVAVPDIRADLTELARLDAKPAAEFSEGDWARWEALVEQFRGVLWFTLAERAHAGEAAREAVKG